MIKSNKTKKHKNNLINKSSKKSSKKTGIKSIKFGGNFLDEENKDVVLQQCLDHLNHPDMDNLPPKICYNKLDFPNDVKSVEIPPGPSYMFFKEQFPKLISISEPITVYDDMKMWIPDNIKTSLAKKSTRFTIIPINFKNTQNYYAILLDNKNQEWQIFIPPGNHQVNNHCKIEIKIRSLIDEHLKIPVRYFYECIQYQPKPNTFHFDFWPSWIIYQRIKKTQQREVMVNDALEKLLRKSPEYTDFINQYQLYLSK